MKKPTEAWRSTSLFEAGIRYVVACRDKANGNAEPGGVSALPSRMTRTVYLSFRLNSPRSRAV